MTFYVIQANSGKFIYLNKDLDQYHCDDLNDATLFASEQRAIKFIRGQNKVRKLKVEFDEAPSDENP